MSEAYQYALWRVVPDAERGECVNAGVVLYSPRLRFLGARVAVDESRIRALAPEVDLPALSTALQSEPAPSREPSAVFFYSFVAHTHVGSATATRNAVLRLDMDASNQGKFWRVLEWD